MLLSACKRPVAVGVQGTRRYVHWADVAVRRFQAKHSVKANKGPYSHRADLAFSTNTNLTTIAQNAWEDFVHEGSTVVDATAGNGGDTLWLAKAVGALGRVYVFDKQPTALRVTRERLSVEVPAGAMPSMVYINSCHSAMLDSVAPGCASLVCFNLGYLPSSDQPKNATTTVLSTTISALNAALVAVKSGGLISVIAYTGHPGGLEESEAVKQFMQSLPPAKYTCIQYKILNRPTAPVCMLLQVR